MADWISTKQAMRVFGVGSTTIKRWAAAGALPYTRTVGGHRRFDRAAVEALLAANNGSTEDTAKLRYWLRTLLKADVPAICDRVRELRSDYQDWFEVADFLGDVLTKVGHSLADGELSIVEEHIASGKLSQSALSVSSDFPVMKGADACLLATPSGEHHTGGLVLLSLCMRSAGIDVQWMGGDTPCEELALQIRKSVDAPRWLALSASQWMMDSAVLDETCRVLGAECQKRGVSLLVGGSGAWPDTLAYGRRFTSFGQLQPLLGSP